MADDRIGLYRETNERFWTRTNYKRGQRLDPADPRDRAMMKEWMRIYAEVRREHAISLAQRVYAETRVPYVLVTENPDGSVTHHEFQTRGQLDSQFSWTVDEMSGRFAYLAAFDLSQDARGPVREMFAQVHAPQAPAPSADARVEAALDLLRAQARDLAQRSSASILGVVLRVAAPPYTPPFTTIGDAVAWMRRAIEHQDAYTYLAYFDKTGPMWPYPVGESIGLAGA